MDKRISIDLPEKKVIEIKKDALKHKRSFKSHLEYLIITHLLKDTK